MAERTELTLVEVRGDLGKKTVCRWTQRRSRAKTLRCETDFSIWGTINYYRDNYSRGQERIECSYVSRSEQHSVTIYQSEF